MTISGLRTTENWTAGVRPKNWREGILRLYPNGKMPLTGLTSQMKSKSTDDPEFNWFEKQMQTRRLALTTAIADGTTTAFPFAGGGAFGFKKGDLFWVEATGEIVYVAADPVADTALTVTRGYSGSTAAAIPIASANPYIVCIGSAQEEGSLPPLPLAFDPTSSSNYTQIFRNTFAITGTAEQTNTRTGDDFKESKRECLELHGVDMERAFIFGKKFQGTLNGKPVRTTGGIISAIPGGNITTFAAPITIGDLETLMLNVFRFGSDEKLALCGNLAVNTINQVVRKLAGARWNIDKREEYGMKIWEIFSPFGTLLLKTHPLFNQMAGVVGTYNSMDSNLLILDMGQMTYRSMRNRDTKFQPDLQAIGEDSMKAGYISECGLQVGFPTTHYYAKGLAAAA